MMAAWLNLMLAATVTSPTSFSFAAIVSPALSSCKNRTGYFGLVHQLWCSGHLLQATFGLLYSPSSSVNPHYSISQLAASPSLWWLSSASGDTSASQA